jgi:hypothetical protein
LTVPNEGIFIYGHEVPGNPVLGIPIVFRDDGLPMVRPGVPVPTKVVMGFTGYLNSQITAIDGAFVILYKWPLTPWVQRRVIHVVARRVGDDLKWRVAPESEPVIPDPDVSGGWTFTAKSDNDRWGVEMNRTTP